MICWLIGERAYFEQGLGNLDQHAEMAKDKQQPAQ